MQKLKMHTPDIAEENYKKLAGLFPNAVTETKDENGNVVRAIDKDVLMQEINAKDRSAISLHGRIKGSLLSLRMLRLKKLCALKRKSLLAGMEHPEGRIPKIFISRAIIWMH